MNKILKPVAHGLSLAALLFISDAQAIIGVAPGGSVARRHAVVATTTVVAASSANASAAAIGSMSIGWSWCPACWPASLVAFFWQSRK